jgi:hypothetical protein
MKEPEREVYHDTPPTKEELAGNARTYCYGGQDVFPLKPMEDNHAHSE